MNTMPRDLNELESLLKGRPSPKEVFGDEPRLTHRQLLAICHPDRNYGNPSAEAIFKEIESLYALLNEKPTVVKSPKRSYTVTELLKAGDLADIHLAESDDGGKYILKISRIPDGHKMLDVERKTLADILTAAGDNTYRKYYPMLCESFPAADKIQKRVNVYIRSLSRAYTAEEIRLKLPGLDGRHLAWMFKRMLIALGFAHRTGYVHGNCLPPHCLFDAANHGMQLLSWSHSVPLGGVISSVSKRYKTWYPPEVLEKRQAGPWTDIYLAARTTLYLAGVDDPSKPWKLDESLVSVPEQRFLQSCVLPGAKMRPSDAWTLHDEFADMLKTVYGKPKFVELNIPN